MGISEACIGRPTRPVRVRGKLMAIAMFAFAAQTALQGAIARGAELSGKDVVDAVCASCHASGAQGAPKIGDQKAWSKRATHGLTGLTANALKGIRQMPPHGGNMNLTDLEIKRGVAYMVNQSGGKWVEPVSTKSPPVARTGEEIVKAQCIKCHQAGTGGAPRIGDRDAWIPRLKDGLDGAVRSAMKGHGTEPHAGTGGYSSTNAVLLI